VTDFVQLRGARIVEPGVGVGPRTDVRLEGGRIAAVGEGAGERSGSTAVVELDGLWLAPGLIDIQVNGAAGHDTTDDPSSIWAVGEAVAATGVTAFLPTIVTAPEGRIDEAIRIVEAGPPTGYRGATVLGLHLEGPFLSPKRHGAHDPAFLRAPDAAFAAGWSRDAGVAIVTIAPELPGALDLIRALAARGVVVSIGHSNATLDEARAGIDAGARYATHLYNAMRPLEHRDPGIAAAALADERVTVGMIPDRIHVDPTVLDLAYRVAGPDRFSIVTDAMGALGMPYGTFQLGGREVTVDETGCRLPDGLLAGSNLRLDVGVQNLAAATGRRVELAVVAATTVPARLLGLADRGRITPGARADLTIVTPDFGAAGTIVDGRVAWTSRYLEQQVAAWA
jgi:N-acetylglucosamine-6-phosphate deacetylase